MNPVFFEEDWSQLIRPQPPSKEIDHRGSLDASYYEVLSGTAPDSVDAISHDYANYQYPSNHTIGFAPLNQRQHEYFGSKPHPTPTPTYFDLLMGDATLNPLVDSELYHFVQDISLGTPCDQDCYVAKPDSVSTYPLNPLINACFDRTSCREGSKCDAPQCGPFDTVPLSSNYLNEAELLKSATNTYTLSPFGVFNQIADSYQRAQFDCEYQTHQITPSAVLRVKTELRPKYWRNGRRNLQCFPLCESFGDYSLIKIDEIRRHDFMWGKCRGKVEVEVWLRDSETPSSKVIVLGRIHMVGLTTLFSEAVLGECRSGQIVSADDFQLMRKDWMVGELSADHVAKDEKALFTFKPKVWKYSDDMGKKKKSNKTYVKYYVQFEAFLAVEKEGCLTYHCIGSGSSTGFDVGSSRVLARQKRKAATKDPASPQSVSLVGIREDSLPQYLAPLSVPCPKSESKKPKV